nr:MAG TPA: Neck appendage protein [Caudoviricetes sp.]
MIYLTDGNIPLNAAYDDNITQEANSTYQLTFKFPTNNILWQRLREETFLTADDLHGEQDFVIFEIEKQHGYIQVYANQVMTLLNYYVVNPINLDRETGSTALSRFAGSITRDNKFSFFSDINDRHTFNSDTKNAMEVLTKDKHSILSQWGGDLVRHGYQVRLLKNGGSENESLFMYKKNLSSYQHKTSTKSLKTRITFTTTVKGEGENADDKHYKVVVDSQLIDKYNQIYEDVVEVNDQDVKDEASLREYGRQYFLTSLCDLMEDSIEIDVVGQSDVPVQMFDIVGIYHETFDLDVRKKITKYTYSPIAKKLKSIGFGKFKSGLANAIGNVVSDAVKNETYIFEAKLEKEIKNADLDFDRKVQVIKDEITDGIEQAKTLAEENKRALSDEIDRRFHDFSPSGFEEAKNKAEEALKKARAGFELADKAKHLIDETQITFASMADRVNRQEDKLNDTVTDLKRYSREETENQITAVRETLSRNYVAKSTFTETVESTNQRFETLKRDNEITLADYKQGIDGRFANIASQIAGKVNNVDFQRVKETSQLYERILGSSESDISRNASRLVMSDQIFQTEVGKYVTDDNNLIVNSMTMDKNTLVGNNNPKASVSVVDGIFTIQAQGLTSYNWSGFSLPIYVKKIYKDETYTLGFKYRIREYPDSTFAFNVKNHGLNKTLLSSDIGKNRPPLNKWQEFQKTFTVQEDFAFGEDYNYPFYIYLAKNGWIEFKEPILVRGSKTGPYKPSQFDDAYKQTKEAKDLAESAQTRAIQVAEKAEEAKRTAEATRTQVTQIAGSYAIQNLNSAGSIISQINATNNQILIEAEKIRLKGKTLLDEITAIDGYFKRLFVGDARIGKLNTDIIESNSITADKVIMDSAMAKKIVSSDVFTDQLAAKNAFINKLRSVVVSATLLEGYKGRIGGFQIGTHDRDPNSYWLTGLNQFKVGMGNGTGKADQVALWVNWGNNWGKSGWNSWYVDNNGQMFCKGKVNFYNQVDFSDTTYVNFYSKFNALKGIWTGTNDINGDGGNPAGGQNAVVWWNQITTGKWRQHAGITTASDRRLKENIKPTSVNALDKIKELNLIAFDYIKDKSYEEIGLIAQEVQEVIPSAIETYAGEDTHLTINYSKFIPYLIKAIQELNQKLEKVNEGRN